MKRAWLSLLWLLPAALGAAEAPATLEEAEAELRARLEGARAVPYLDDKGVHQGYIVSDPHSPDPSSLKLKKGDVLTAPQLTEDDEAAEPE